MSKSETGFTLLEALACLAVATILLALAVPAWSSAVAKARTHSAQAELFASLTVAMNHATVTGVPVVLCPGKAGACRDSSDWSAGWFAYADLDGDRRHDAAETLLDVRSPLEGGVHLRTSSGRKRIVVQPDGGTAGSNATFTLCNVTAHGVATTLKLANTGRLRVASASPEAARSCVGDAE